ncbi:MAG TPA: phospho-N-acetylmuramoyl-pentapeptide-transferase [Acidimicrobiales bacterium]|nr:phospho-N-acetylmuramoyl-pentapeptide-transferase [Acidimicrobiales bacterium]
MIPLLIAGGVSLLVSLVGTRYLIDWLIAHQVGQPIQEDGPQGHVTKAGTPTMGGVAFVVAALLGYLAAHVRSGLVFTRTGLIVMATIAGAGAVGALDDWIKVSRERNLGLSSRAKMLGLLVVAVGFAVAMVNLTEVDTTISFTRFDSPGIDIPGWIWVVWAILLIAGTTNAVNLTDGLDGLAAGSSIFAFITFVFIGFWTFRHPEVYGVEHALDLAVIAAAMLGGVTGFLWWNANPARIFMGDTGSLAIGAALACLALTTNTQLLLPVVGFLFVLETVSVMLQVTRFRLTGKRFFRMAPIHHHFELGGWPETTVIIRLWIMAGLATALALGLFYADFIGTGGID